MEVVYIIAGIIFLIVHVSICIVLGQIAESKGWEKSKYFLFCLFGGIMGALLVIALPDKDSYKFDKITSNNSKKMLDELSEIKTQLAQIVDNSNN